MRTTAYSGEDVVPITHAEAMALVQSREQAHERALDRKEAELLGAQIKETAVAELGYQRVILNRVPLEKAIESEERKSIQPIRGLESSIFFEQGERDVIHVNLSGTVRGGISELWWWHEGNSFKIFTNANFLWFNAWDKKIEDEKSVYSIFPLIVEAPVLPMALHSEAEWRPSSTDFSDDQLEYYLVQSSGVPKLDAEAERFVMLMLEFYRDNVEDMKIAYDNAKKMRLAREAYLEANPPKKRDVIINSAPINKADR